MNTQPQQYNPTTTQNTIEASEAPARSNLARVIESLCLEPRPLDPQLFSNEHLARLHTSFVGRAFHICNKAGELLRRGIVVEDNRTHYVVYFADPFSGLPIDKSRVPKANTSLWKWFDNVEQSNAAYDKMFGVTN